MTGIKEPAAYQEALDSTQGWLIVGLGICVPTVIWGTVPTFTVYADRLATIFNLTQLQVLSIFPITTAVFLMAGGLFGVFAVRFSLRPILVIISVGLIAAIVLFRIVNSYPGVVVVFSLLGTTGGTALTVTVSLMPQWFDSYQGFATSLTMTGIGLGPLALPSVWIWHWCSVKHWIASRRPQLLIR